MTAQINVDDPQYAASAAEILRRHERRCGLRPTSLAPCATFSSSPGWPKVTRSSRKLHLPKGPDSAVDLSALNTFIEFKRRIGSARGFDPNPEYVEQLDDYLAQSEATGTSVRMGILTDGKHWLLRWPNAGDRQNDRALRLHAGELRSLDSPF